MGGSVESFNDVNKFWWYTNSFKNFPEGVAVQRDKCSSEFDMWKTVIGGIRAVAQQGV